MCHSIKLHWMNKYCSSYDFLTVDACLTFMAEKLNAETLGNFH